MNRAIIVPLIITVLLIIVIFLLFTNLESYFTNVLAAKENNQLQYALYSFGILTSDIVLPIPSSIVMYSNGLILGVYKGFLLSMMSLLSGSVIGYHIGFLSRFKRKALFEVQAARVLENHGYLAILLTRGIPILSESICIVCGYNKMRFGKYLKLNALGFIPVSAVYSVCGSIAVSKNAFLFSFSISVLVSGIFWLIGENLKSKPKNT